MVKLMVGLGGGRMTTVYLSLTSPSSLSGGEGEGIAPPPPFWTISTRPTPILYPELSFSPPCRVSQLLRELFTGAIRLHVPNCIFHSEAGCRGGAHGRMRAFRNQHPGDILTA